MGRELESRRAGEEREETGKGRRQERGGKTEGWEVGRAKSHMRNELLSF